MNSNSLSQYVHLLNQLKSYGTIPQDLISSFKHYILLIYESDQQNRFSEPMLWIGIYIALASLFCVFAMVADLLNGLRTRKLWFPCKYFTLNAASLSVIAVALKLPMDLNNSMPGHVDQVAKLGSMAFMCIMMANLLPSPAAMDNKQLLTNIIALGVLVITLVVNVCIQINTGILSSYINNEDLLEINYDAKALSTYASMHNIIATFFVCMLLMLLTIHVCSTIAILKSKQILESKYQAGHEEALKDLQTAMSTVKNLKQHVRNYWILAGSGSPQFISACLATSSASGVICAISTVIHILIMNFTFHLSTRDYKSDYKWSMLVIFIIQSIGVVLGTIAPLFRCFADLSFKLTRKWTWNHINVFKVENYWIQMLSDWKQSSIPFSTSSRKCKIFIHNMKILILGVCIGIQKTAVVTCKMIGLFYTLFVICIWCCFHSWQSLKAMLIASSILLVANPEQGEQNLDILQYVLQLQDDMVLSERALKGITNSFDIVIQNAENHKPVNLMNLLVRSNGFNGVRMYDNLHVPPLPPAEEYLNSWSLPLVTLTTIAISLPNIQNSNVDNLLRSVSEGLVYVTLVEESLNASNDYVSVQKAARTLWLEVEVYHKWLGNKLRELPLQVNTARQILEWFGGAAEKVVREVEGMDIEGSNENSFCRSMCANSMYRITQTILLPYRDNNDEVGQVDLFVQLRLMISEIFAACLTNLPQVIAMKCHTNVIEKREASVQSAAQLLGQTTWIINTLQNRVLPLLNLEDLAFIDNWRSYLAQQFP